MMSLGVAGLSAFPWQTLVGSVLPLVCGMILGNIDFELREFLGRAVPVMIPFFSFALGGTLNLASVATAGLLGIGVDYRFGRHYRSDCAFSHCLLGPTLCQIWRTSGMKNCLILADDL